MLQLLLLVSLIGLLSVVSFAQDDTRANDKIWSHSNNIE